MCHVIPLLRCCWIFGDIWESRSCGWSLLKLVNSYFFEILSNCRICCFGDVCWVSVISVEMLLTCCWHYVEFRVLSLRFLILISFCWVSAGSLLSLCWVSGVSVEFFVGFIWGVEFLLSFVCFCWVSVEIRVFRFNTDSTRFNTFKRFSTDSAQIQQSSYMAVVATSAISAGWDLVIAILQPPFRDTRHHYGSRCYITKSSYMAVAATSAMCMSAGWGVAITTWFGRYVYVCRVGHVVITT